MNGTRTVAKDNGKLMPEIARWSRRSDRRRLSIRNPSTQVNDVESGNSTGWLACPRRPLRRRVKDKFEGTQFKLEPTITTYYFGMKSTPAPVQQPESARSGELCGRPCSPRT